MKQKIYGIIAVALAAWLAALPASLKAQERRGAQLVVTKNDGTVVQGELLAVKGTDLLIMDGSASAGVSVSLADAKLVKVVKRGKAAKIIEGVLLGGIVGGGLGYATESVNHEFLSGIAKAAAAATGMGIGILVGGGVGVAMGSSKKFPIVSTDPYSVSFAASKLRPLARDPS